MFMKTSRYFKVNTVDVPLADGRTVSAVRLRRLPPTRGEDVVVKGSDRLDLMAWNRLRDPTGFWRVADANTELEANDLAAETGRVIKTPEP